MNASPESNKRQRNAGPPVPPKPRQIQQGGPPVPPKPRQIRQAGPPVPPKPRDWKEKTFIDSSGENHVVLIQDEFDNCGPTCVGNILSRIGITRFSYDDIHAICGDQSGGLRNYGDFGTMIEGIEHTLNQLKDGGADYFVERKDVYNDSKRRKAVRAALEKGAVIVAQVDWDNGGSHFVIFAKFIRKWGAYNRYIVYDPFFGGQELSTLVKNNVLRYTASNESDASAGTVRSGFLMVSPAGSKAYKVHSLRVEVGFQNLANRGAFEEEENPLWT